MAEKTLQGLLFAFVSDGAGADVMIRAGERFDLIPPERRTRTKDRPVWMRLWLGEGPYVATFIAYNPHPAFTGKPLLFCKWPDGSESGAFASEFEKAWPRWVASGGAIIFIAQNKKTVSVSGTVLLNTPVDWRVYL